MTRLTTVSELRNWVDSALGGDATPADIDGVTQTIQADDHPAWGADWTEYLESLDLWALCMANEAAKPFVETN